MRPSNQQKQHEGRRCVHTQPIASRGQHQQQQHQLARRRCCSRRSSRRIRESRAISEATLSSLLSRQARPHSTGPGLQVDGRAVHPPAEVSQQLVPPPPTALSHPWSRQVSEAAVQSDQMHVQEFSLAASSAQLATYPYIRSHAGAFPPGFGL